MSDLEALRTHLLVLKGQREVAAKGVNHADHTLQQICVEIQGVESQIAKLQPSDPDCGNKILAEKEPEIEGHGV